MKYDGPLKLLAHSHFDEALMSWSCFQGEPSPEFVLSNVFYVHDTRLRDWFAGFYADMTA